MNIKAAVYGALALIGAVWTWYFNLQAMDAELGAGAFFTMGFANPVSSSLTADLTIACLAFIAWLPFEARRLQMRNWWVYLVLTFGIAFACSFPLFLFMRERKLIAQGSP